jgi:hypothetical protein
MKKFIKTENIASLAWMAFGIIGVIRYYPKKDILAIGVSLLITILFSIKLVKNIVKNKEPID